MKDILPDILRGFTMSIMNAVLLFQIAQPRFNKKVTNCVIGSVFLLDMISSVYFYLFGELTLLAKFDVILFFSFAVILKPFVKDNIMQWLFNFLTAVNVYFIVIYISYFACDLFPSPLYWNSIIRMVLYCILIVFYNKKVKSVYREMVDNWRIYFALVLSISINFIYYIISSDDIELTFQNNVIPITLLIILTFAIYSNIISVFQKSQTEKKLIMEKEYFKKIAYIDPLTKTGNRNKLEQLITVDEKCILNRSTCIGVFDINDLKKVNDQLGHDIGDKYIFDCCQIICKAFKNSAVFRTGGDEFLLITKDCVERYIQDSINKMDELIKEFNIKGHIYRISIACGFAFYNEKKHTSFEDVKKEADIEMYKSKKAMKSASVSNSVKQ